MPAIANLPPLKSETDSIEPPDMHGIWVGRSGSALLRKIADSLDHKDDVQKDDDGTTLAEATITASVPDVWAQVEVFRNDLFYDGNEPIKAARRAKAVTEWRALLALLALKDRNSYTVQALPLDFGASKAVGTEGALGDGEDASDLFFAVCGRLLPKSVAYAQQSWTSISVLKVSSQTVGLFVPSTLVAPARDYDVRLAGITDFIPWYVGGEFKDPTLSSVGLRPRDYLLLAVFLKRLLDTLRTAPAADAHITNALIGLANAYEADCRKAAGTLGTADATVQPSGSLGLDLPTNQPIYGALNSIYRTVGGTEHQTRLKPRATAPNLFRGLILSDVSDGFRRLGVRAANLVLWGDLTQERAMHDRAALEKARLEARAQGFVLLDVADLFAPQIVSLTSGRAPRHGSALDRYSLPLSPVALLVYEPDELLHAVRIEQQASGDVRVSLSMQFVNENGNIEGTYSAERLYRLEKKEVLQRSVPVATSIWPNFQSDSWRFYTAFHRGQPRTDVVISRALSPKALFTKVAQADGYESAVAAIGTWISGNQAAGQEVPIARGEIISDVFVSDGPIEALACGLRLTPQADRIEATGFILAPATTVVSTSQSTETAVAGVDFGTSNSCIYLKVGPNGVPTEAQFQNRQLIPLLRQQSDGATQIDPLTFADFMPPMPADMPFLSLLKSRESATDRVDEDLPFGRSHIWFVSDLEDSMLKALGNDPNLHFNLKWSKSSDDRVRLRALLRQAALLGLAEAAAQGIPPASVEWAFSYPMTQNFNEKDYRASCQLSVDSALEAATGTKAKARLSEEITESEAAAIYFRDRKLTAFSGTTITIDIGGGTSDISVWSGTSQVWRYSFELAGRKILLSYLRRRDAFVRELCKGAQDKKALATVESRFNSKQFTDALARTPKSRENKDASDPVVKMLELLINNSIFKDQLARRLSDLSGETDGATLKWQTTLALAGMLYFVGRQLTVMKNGLSLDQQQGVTVCLSGRGSAIYRSLFSDVHELEQRLRAVFLAASGCSENVPFSIVYSPAPKHEAAYGLVADWRREGDRDALMLKGKDRLNTISIGERVKVDGKQVLDPLTLADTLLSAKSLELVDLEEMQNFLKIMAGLKASTRASDRSDGVRVNIEPFKALLTREINQELANWVKASDGTKPLVHEPIFLVSLRLLIDLVNDKELALVPVQ
jgi:hypothetical protein